MFFSLNKNVGSGTNIDKRKIPVFDKCFFTQLRQSPASLSVRLWRKELKPINVGDSDLFVAMKMIAETGNGPKSQIPSMGCNIKWIK